jgi:hypothetical protein
MNVQPRAIKLPEEGKIWEWRAFGRIDADLAARVNALPVRNGLIGHPDQDIYLISPVSDQNVKLRKLGNDWALKFKVLLQAGADSIELYQESMDTVYSFPVNYDTIIAAARLLNTQLPLRTSPPVRLGPDELVNVFEDSTPKISHIDVPKVRSQFVVDGGWVEMADVNFPHNTVQTISIHSFEKRAVEQCLDLLGPGGDLRVMNYIEACRKWG